MLVHKKTWTFQKLLLKLIKKLNETLQTFQTAIKFFINDSSYFTCNNVETTKRNTSLSIEDNKEEIDVPKPTSFKKIDRVKFMFQDEKKKMKKVTGIRIKEQDRIIPRSNKRLYLTKLTTRKMHAENNVIIPLECNWTKPEIEM